MKEKAWILVCAAFAACASDPPPAPAPTKAKRAEWDYARIRDARQAEEANTPPAALRRQSADDCQVLTRDQMIRAKASGCRPMNPREGGGADSFCCPRD